MKDTKPWYASNGTWASIATIVTGVLVAFGVLTPEQATVAKEAFPELAAGTATSIFGLWSLIGRLRAKKRITK